MAVDPFEPRENKFRRDFLLAAVLIAIPLSVILVAHPTIDLAISSALRSACPVPPVVAKGPWCPTTMVTASRQLFMGIFLVIALATLAAGVRIVRSERKLFGLAQARCWFMIAVLIVGPGVVTNLILKDNVGRARPRDVIEFGGNKMFTPPLTVAHECPRNCSFVSGEASSMFAAFFALALLLPQYRLALLATALSTGLLAGIVRMVQGAHFLSDILFAGVFMAITVSVLHIAFIGVWRDPRRIREAYAATFAPLARAASTAWVRS